MSSFELPELMGIINSTPDSFSDGGRFLDSEKAIEQGLRLLDEGAAIIDVGGESTRPGASEVSIEEELQRVIPVIEGLRRHGCQRISIDTRKTEVMRQAVAAGASLINDVNALKADQAVEFAAAVEVEVCLMHMRGEPRSMQQSPEYADVVSEVRNFLLQRVAVCEAAGIDKQKIIIDPGFGFGKTLHHNYKLLAQLESLVIPQVRLLVGISRKSMIGNLLQRELAERLPGSLSAALLAAQKGAKIIRVHDVAATLDVLRVWQEVRLLETQEEE